VSQYLTSLTEALADRYRLKGELGRGGMAIVYLAEDLKHGRSVAIKVLHPDLSSAVGADRFRREVDFAARLTHPNILPLHDSGQAAGLLYYVMPYVEDESLRDRLTRGRQLPIEEAIRITREAAEALSHAHACGIVHRDIKPENILLLSGHAVVSDFGIARVLQAVGGERLTATGLTMGTPAYMSPEQAAGDEAIDGRADVYSLACVAYEMLGGEPPFTGPSPQAVMARHAMDPVPPLRTMRPTVSEAVDRVLAKAMAKVPADRFTTPFQFAEALEHAHVTGAAPGVPASSRARWRRRPRTVAVAGLVVLALVVFGSRAWRGMVGAPRLSSLAVLPFDNLSGDSTQEYFVAGMHDALVGALGQIGSLRVTWRSTRFLGDTKSIPEIARDLGVDGVVTATVLRGGDSVHLQVRLIRARAGEELAWAESYSTNVIGVLTLYGEVARAIARQARGEVTEEQESRLAAARTIDPETYEAYLRGMYFLQGTTAEDRRRGISYLEDAVARNPGDAHAYAGLALGYSTLGHGPAAPPDAWQRARAAAERAVTLAPELAEAHAALADVRLYYDNDWAGAEREFRRTIELNPSLALNHYHFAWYLALVGRYDEAYAEHQAAQELDPLTPAFTAHFGGLYLQQGRFDEAIAEARKVLDRDSVSWIGLGVLGEAYSLMGRHDEAIATLRRAAAINPSQRLGLGTAYARAGRTDDARRLLAEMAAEPPSAYGAFARALIHGDLGDLDDAFRLLDYRPAHAWLPWVRWWPGQEGLRKDPRYHALMRRLNLSS
jgi:serine/threonine-protein kinase